MQTVLSLLLGYIVWTTVNTYTLKEYTAPFTIYLYNNTKDKEYVCVPETISVTMTGPLNVLQNYMYDHEASAHIDLSKCEIPENGIYTHIITAEDIFLPDTIKLVYCCPVVIKSKEII